MRTRAVPPTSATCSDRLAAPAAAPPWSGFVPSGVLAAFTAGPLTAPPRKRLRQVAVLFVDIEGCTRMCEDLPPRTMSSIIEAYFSGYLDAVRARGGEVIEVMGDGLLALFEGPGLRANVRAAVAATEAIQAITTKLNRSRFRGRDPITVNVGMNAGRAFTGITRLRGRAGERWFLGATGPVTNIAARLCALASGGQALTTRDVAELLPAQCERRPLGPQALKNVTGMVEVVQFASPGGRRARMP